MGRRLRGAWPIHLLAGLQAATLFALLLAGQWSVQVLSGGAGELALFAGRAAGTVALCTTMLFALGLYSWHVAHGYIELALKIAVALGLAFALYAVAAYVVPGLRIPLGALLPALAVGAAGLFGLHAAFLRLADMAHLKTRILVLGTGPRAARLAALAQRGRLSRFCVVAFVELEPVETAVPADRVIAVPNDLAAYAKAQRIEELVVAMEDRRGQLPLDGLVAARFLGLRVSDYTVFAETALGAVDLEALRHSWFFDQTGFRAGAIDRLVKRATDVGLSALLVLVTLPVLLLTALAIKLESPGPVFYRQERVGKGGRPFMLVKFRSMRDDAEADGRPKWADKGDPRVTRVGALIRKTRIDEIPQAINVLKGDMSFVGPRPERPFFVESLCAQMPFYRERHNLKPGLTGWAQLNYPYGASVEDARMKLQYDLFYIKYFSLVLDLAIVLQTVRVVLWNAGAR